MSVQTLACLLSGLFLAGCTATVDDFPGPCVPPSCFHVPAAPRSTSPQIQWMYGREAEEIFARLGKPRDDKVSGNTRLLDYFNETCNLSIFMRRESARLPFLVTHVLALDENVEWLPDGPCAQSFLTPVRGK